MGRPSRRGVDRNLIHHHELSTRSRRPSRRGVDRNSQDLARGSIGRTSPLTQGRGSKQPKPPDAGRIVPSPLTQGRGSKHFTLDLPPKRQVVAPHAGAWIETAEAQKPSPDKLNVAPHAGAWIETWQTTQGRRHSASPLTQGRGSKRDVRVNVDEHLRSPLTQGRGSKQGSPALVGHDALSPLTQGRGSKLRRDGQGWPDAGSPLTQGRGSKLAFKSADDWMA